jgi:hypothetical protein
MGQRRKPSPIDIPLTDQQATQVVANRQLREQAVQKEAAYISAILDTQNITLVQGTAFSFDRRDDGYHLIVTKP